MTALAPCPVSDCDGKSPFLCSEGTSRPNRPNWFVHCANCAMRGPQGADADQAIGRWNALAEPAKTLDSVLANVPDALRAGSTDEELHLFEPTLRNDQRSSVDPDDRLPWICNSLARILVNVRDKRALAKRAS